jgi:hypothetical protein
VAHVAGRLQSAGGVPGASPARACARTRGRAETGHRRARDSARGLGLVDGPGRRRASRARAPRPRRQRAVLSRTLRRRGMDAPPTCLRPRRRRPAPARGVVGKRACGCGARLGPASFRKGPTRVDRRARVGGWRRVPRERRAQRGPRRLPPAGPTGAGRSGVVSRCDGAGGMGRRSAQLGSSLRGSSPRGRRNAGGPREDHPGPARDRHRPGAAPGRPAAADPPRRDAAGGFDPHRDATRRRAAWGGAARSSARRSHPDRN